MCVCVCVCVCAGRQLALSPNIPPGSRMGQRPRSWYNVYGLWSLSSWELDMYIVYLGSTNEECSALLCI